MLEFCFTHPGSIRMLFPGGRSVTIQSTSVLWSQREREKKKKKGDTEVDRWCFPLRMMITFLPPSLDLAIRGNLLPSAYLRSGRAP